MLIRWWTCTSLVGLVASSGWSSAAAQKRATVTVSVELAVPRYRDRFTDRKAVQAKAAYLFADYLARNVGFLRFAADDSTRPYRLSFVLDRFDRGSTSGFSEVGFWVRLERPDETPKESYWLQFRSADQALSGVGGEDGFLNEIKAKLAHRDADSLRTGVLRWIPISETGLPNLEPLGFVLPFRLLDLCMKRQSTVELLAEFGGTVVREVPVEARVVGTFNPSGQTTRETAPYVGGGFAMVTPLPQPDDLTPSIARHSVKVKKIFVTSYVHDPTACGNRAPMAVGGATP
jgi:hypothetical protein